MPPTLLFGTSTLGMDGTSFQHASDIGPLFTLLKSGEVAHLDTAARYPPLNPGRSEQLLGEANVSSENLLIDTKIATPTPDGRGELTREAVRKSVEESLNRLKVKKVNVLYAHRMDEETSIEEQVRAFDEQIDAGRCVAVSFFGLGLGLVLEVGCTADQGQWGVSNHSIPQLETIFKVCDERRLPKPAVYQGAYNAVTRGMEKELLPLLRRHGVRFVAYR